MAVDQAEDGDVGADADGQSQQGPDEERRLLREAAPGMDEIAKGPLMAGTISSRMPRIVRIQA